MNGRFFIMRHSEGQERRQTLHRSGFPLLSQEALHSQEPPGIGSTGSPGLGI